ncbi:hypothetical protein QBC46DRAFT_390160 [Diplogelasinospora grovesii]|uniref:SGNH hydrolase-type esterase domain-containing protein n=1 Tax=Diplogelasinospora grovesii TaxID=303347 RepID=A0AAN6N3C6_9PEZI|nr:hypothetical protein QBC46DRAFT_390160 [Diplogelasinospora grovesii]
MATNMSRSSAAAAAAAEVEALLRPFAKFKDRSHQTSKTSHIPLLQNHPDGPTVVLLGDSMIERMTTTGCSPSFEPWPSETMLGGAHLQQSSAHADPDAAHEPPHNMRQLTGVFNAGVGGDRIQNIMYRLIGSDDTSNSSGDDEGLQLPGLAPVLAERPIKLWVVQAGTNNLHLKKGLMDKDRDAMQLLLQALVKLSGNDCKILLTGLFPRTDIKRELIDQANDKLREMVGHMNTELEKVEEKEERVVFLPAPEINADEHLEDHVHLNLTGYRLWARGLVPKVIEILGSSSTS